jgi:hypothetical protein
MMKRLGLIVDSQTLWDQLDALGRWLEPLRARLHAYVLAQGVIGADETFWRLMGAGQLVNKRWQTWAVVAPDAVSYSILDSRSATAAAEVLGDYAGTLICDRYSAYQSLKSAAGVFSSRSRCATIRSATPSAEAQMRCFARRGTLTGCRRTPYACWTRPSSFLHRTEPSSRSACSTASAMSLPATSSAHG